MSMTTNPINVVAISWPVTNDWAIHTRKQNCAPFFKFSCVTELCGHLLYLMLLYVHSAMHLRGITCHVLKRKKKKKLRWWSRVCQESRSIDELSKCACTSSTRDGSRILKTARADILGTGLDVMLEPRVSDASMSLVLHASAHRPMTIVYDTTHCVVNVMRHYLMFIYRFRVGTRLCIHVIDTSCCNCSRKSSLTFNGWLNYLVTYVFELLVKKNLSV